MGTKRVLEARPSLAAQSELQHDWGNPEVEGIYRTPLQELVFRAQTIHRAHHAADRLQSGRLISSMVPCG